MFRFEKLDVWQRAIELADSVYKQTQTFPTDERFGLTSQLRRSAVSVAANIAEGSGRVSDKDFARFLEVAYGSLMETVSHLFVAKRQGLLSAETFQQLYQDVEQLSRMLSGLRNRLTSSKMK